jgi:hypothetical protein
MHSHWGKSLGTPLGSFLTSSDVGETRWSSRKLLGDCSATQTHSVTHSAEELGHTRRELEHRSGETLGAALGEYAW